MKSKINPLALAAFVAALVLGLSACQTAPRAPSASTPQASPADLARAAREQELDQALDLYAKGQFGPAIVALRPLIDAPELPTPSRLRAIKFSAMSHCVQGQALPCRQLFEQAIKLDPNFQLADTEASHPLWGAEFRRAQRNARVATPPARGATP